MPTTPRLLQTTLPTREALLDALTAQAVRFEALVRSLDAEQAATPIPASSWTVADAVAHVLTVLRRTFLDRRRSRSAAQLAELNATCLAELPERRPGALADQIASDVPRMLAVLADLAPDRPVPFHAGIQTTVQPVLAVLLGEFLIHGYDIAAAADRPWQLAPAEAALLCRGVAPLLGTWLAPAASSAQVACVLQLGPEAPPLILNVWNGRLHLELPADTAPRVLAVDPVELALAVIYKRRAPADPQLIPLADLFLSP
jgi:uncharacterized protein (TIGR03083 family)